MSTLYLTTDQLGARLRAEGRKARRAVDAAIKRAVDRWIVYLKKSVDDQGITNTGGYRDGFAVTTTSGQVAVMNDHPAAAVIELGCAPHPVSIEGRESIYRWCVDKLGLSDKEARSATYLICRKIRESGQEPRYVVRHALPMLYRMYSEELTTELRKVA
jgi:hypothetical protein